MNIESNKLLAQNIYSSHFGNYHSHSVMWLSDKYQQSIQSLATNIGNHVTIDQLATTGKSMVHFLKFLCVRLKEKQKSFSAVKEQRDFERNEKAKLMESLHYAQYDFRTEQNNYDKQKQSNDHLGFSNNELECYNTDLCNKILKLNAQLQHNNDNIDVVSADNASLGKDISIVPNNNETLDIKKTEFDLYECGRRLSKAVKEIYELKLFWVKVSGSDVEADQVKWRNKYLK